MKTFYFLVEGRIESSSEGEATDKLYSLLSESGLVEPFVIKEVTEVDG